MRLVLANPNATAAITEACAALARAIAAPGTEIVPWKNHEGPPVVDGMVSDYQAGAALVRGMLSLAPRPDAIVLAWFGNYGTGAVKEAALRAHRTQWRGLSKLFLGNPTALDWEAFRTGSGTRPTAVPASSLFP